MIITKMPDKIGLDIILNLLNDFNTWSTEDGARISKDWIRNKSREASESHLAGSVQNYISVDKSTLQWKSWNSTTTSSTIIPSEGDQTYDPPLHTLTGVEFRKLKDQVKGSPAGNTRIDRVRRKSFKRYNFSKNGDSTSSVYRNQLATSLKTFQSRHWTPYEGDNPGPDSVMPPRSRPVSSLSDSRITKHTQENYSRPNSSRVLSSRLAEQRPRSSPSDTRQPSVPQIEVVPLTTDQPTGSTERPPLSSDHPAGSTERSSLSTDQPAGSTDPPPLSTNDSAVSRDCPTQSLTSLYDTLTPDIVYELSDGVQPESVYGDRPDSVLSRLAELEQDITDCVSVTSRPSTAPQSRLVGESETVTSQEPLGDSSTAIGVGVTSDKESDLESDEDDYPEPTLSDMNINNIPQLSLRPEKVDALDLPVYARGDRRKYDFDASDCEVVPFLFAEPLSEPMANINLSDMGMSDKNWRDLTKNRPETAEESLIIDRLVEFERLQMRTIEWESAKYERLKAIKLRHSKSRVYPMARVQSAKTWRERKCCRDCVQQACVGDCPDKPISSSTNCLVCAEKQCSGNCCVNVYESRSRSELTEEKHPKPKTKTHHCASCQCQNNAKLINANNLILGRPRSGYATFTRGQASLKPKDMRQVTSADLSDDLHRDLEKLGVAPTAPSQSDSDARKEAIDRPWTPGGTNSKKRHTGRASVLPGKSYFSQRRVSLTDRQLQYDKAKMEANKNIRSARRRRPKTAV